MQEINLAAEGCLPRDPRERDADKTKVTVGGMAFRFSTLGLLAIIAGYLTLYMDRHYDGKYVALATYSENRAADAKDRARERADDAKALANQREADKAARDAEHEADKKAREAERAADDKAREQYQRAQEEIQRQRDTNATNQFTSLDKQLTEIKTLLMKRAIQ